MNYFAYGSNMLTTRLVDRVPGASPVAVARVEGRRLAFHKRSSDESGKCDIPKASTPESVVQGVLFDIPEGQIDELDRHEGVGFGYERRVIEVVTEGVVMAAHTYIAMPGYIDASVVPYDWYYCLVVAGAREHGLPAEYIQSIEETAIMVDPFAQRTTRTTALQALEMAGQFHLLAKHAVGGRCPSD